MNKRLLSVGIVLVALILTGCETVPMTYAQWKQEQINRQKAEAAGIPYKSPTQMRAEAKEMRAIADETKFEPATK